MSKEGEMGDETKATSRARKGLVFLLPPDGIEDVIDHGGRSLPAQSIIDLCAYRTAYSALCGALHEEAESSKRLVAENGELRTSLSLLTTTEKHLRDVLRESRDRCDRARITMEQQTADAAALKAKVESLTAKLAMIEAARAEEAKGRRGTRR